MAGSVGDPRRDPGSAPDRVWLRKCEGFRVYTADGLLLGHVEEVRFGSDPLEPEALAVRGGVLGARLFVMPIASVQEVDPERERVTIGEGASSGAALLADLRRELGLTLHPGPQVEEPQAPV